MNKTLKIYLFFLLLIIVAITFIDSNRPRPVNWIPTYSLNDRIPFGLYVFDKESKHLLKDSKIEKVEITPYEFFTSNYNYQDTINGDYLKKGTFLYIDNNAKLDEESINEILTYVSYGNKAFISANDFPRYLLDTLKLNITSEYSTKNDLRHKVLNQKLSPKEYVLNEGTTNSYFDKIDTLQTTALGTVKQDTAHINFIKVKFYDGTIFLHNQPAAFTNFHLLKDNHFEYAQNVASYIPKGAVYWYIKDQTSGSISSSPMRYILSQPALKWAWWIFLIGLFLFMIFNAKRKQRIIPIIKPLPNTTVEFIKTIGNLYLQEGDYNNIIHKKIIYFLEKIRTEYLIDTTNLDSVFINKLHQKSGKNKQDIEKAVELINNFRRNPNATVESDLIKITNAIETIIL
ncbi:MAG: DUF4350 domain-containing protein [Flavobacterium sp.]|nr:DUF4350 domain-containing protein [Flavobacterium sp.]